MKVLPNAVTPTPCYSLQKLGAIHQIKHFWEIKLSSYYSPVGLAVWSSAALEQSLSFSGARCHGAPRAPHVPLDGVGWVSLAGIRVSVVRKENKAGHISCSCGRHAEGAAFPASTNRARFCLVLEKDQVGSSSHIFQIWLLQVPVSLIIWNSFPSHSCSPQVITSFKCCWRWSWYSRAKTTAPFDPINLSPYQSLANSGASGFQPSSLAEVSPLSPFLC